MEVHMHWDVRSDRPGVGLCFCRVDERFTVDGEANICLVVDSVRLWPSFQATTVVGDGEK